MISLDNMLILTVIAGWVPIGFRVTAFQHRFVQRLKTGFPDEWRRIGAPETMDDEGAPAERSLYWYMFFFDYYDLNDPELDACGSGIRRSYLTAFGWMIGVGFLHFVIRRYGWWPE
jgi:hypothetical protein